MWITWSLQGLIGFLLYHLWSQMQKNTEAIVDLRVELAKNYVTQEDMKILRQRVHDITAWMMGEKTLREVVREGGSIFYTPPIEHKQGGV